MFKAYKYRMYPTKGQIQIIEKHFGHCRYIYNWGLQQRIQYYQETNKSLSYSAQNKQLTQLKKENEWLCDADSQSLQGALRQLDTAYSKFFKEHTGFPKFKSRKNPCQSFSIPQRCYVDFANKAVRLPKIGHVKMKLDRTFEGTIKTMTISRNPTGKYFVSIIVDDQQEYPEKQLYTSDDIIGVDVGIKHFAVLSTGEKIENPKYLKNSLKRLKTLQRRVERKRKGSNNRRKAKAKLALLYEKVTNQRNDFQHKLSAKITRENQAIAVEDLNVAGMVKNHCLAQSISDAAWGKFVSMLEYKALWYGKTLLTIGRFEPSSKRCSKCGYHNHDLTLKVREWLCPSCNTALDRDFNAAVNIKKIAASTISPLDQGVGPVDLFSIEKGMKQEEKLCV